MHYVVLLREKILKLVSHSRGLEQLSCFQGNDCSVMFSDMKESMCIIFV